MDCGLKHYNSFEFPEFDNFTETTYLIQDISNQLWKVSSGKNSIYGEKERTIKWIWQNVNNNRISGSGKGHMEAFCPILTMCKFEKIKSLKNKKSSLLMGF